MTEAPFQFFTLQVSRTTRPTPSFVRVTFGGDDVPRLASGGRDQRVKLFLPRPGQDAPVLPGPDDGQNESALPAVAGILESLPPGIPARVWITLQHAADRWELPTTADAHVSWLVRDESAPTTEEAIRAADDLPGGTPYAWIAGESATVKAVRRHLVGERGFDRKAVKFTGYWRRGTSEDELPHSGEDA
ncbi:siderophore-interacting protein [Streptomyces sp. NPDC050433]|uniref:siderophore-interacting protein n=1 Tax=Streptomyces sp. NPDC050433 TaxID=3365615 RepID=UPI0037B33270